MAIEHWLAGIGGGLEGAVRGYSFAKDFEIEEDRRAEEKRRYEEQKAARDAELRHRHNREGVQDMLSQREAMDRETQLRAQREFIDALPEGPLKDAARAAATGLDLGYQPFKDTFERDHATKEDTRHHGEIEPSLPEHLRNPYHVSGHKLTLKPDEFISPADKARQEAEREAVKRKGALEDYEAKRRIDLKYRPAEKPKLDDDPSLPKGVVSYIATLPSKYGGDYTRADQELQRQLPGLLQSHPRLDVRRLRGAFDALFPNSARTARSAAPGDRRRIIPSPAGRGAAPPASELSGGGRASIPVTPRLPPQASSAPTQPAADARLAELDAQAAALFARTRAERDPAQREALKAEYLQLRAQREAILRGGAR